MKLLAPLALMTVGTVCALTLQEAPEQQPQLDEHRWLQQLVGDWELTIEASMAPGAPTTTWHSTESTRALGEFWIVTEGNADFGGQAFQSLQTVGYDPKQDAFVGSWIDTIQAMMWTYEGSLDESGRVLTLAADGPGMTDPSKTSKYEDRIELVGPDHKRLTSAVQGDDGEWITFMTAEAKRVKKDR
ncbi:MAG: DUF1579 domain-containing protein [Planctomycetota bacterium]